MRNLYLIRALWSTRFDYTTDPLAVGLLAQETKASDCNFSWQS